LLGFQVAGISRDSVASHQKFVCKYALEVPLLSDKDETVCRLFDVIKEKNMYAFESKNSEFKEVGILNKSLVIFDTEERYISRDIPIHLPSFALAHRLLPGKGRIFSDSLLVAGRNERAGIPALQVGR